MNEYIRLLRENGNYRRLWLGNVISLLGDWFNLLASAELITDLTNSGVAISYLFMARFLPLFIFSPLAGVLADRYSRRTIMIVSDLLRAMTVLCFLLVRASEQVWLLYVLTITQFALSAMFTPARSAILANVVARKDLVTANALDSLTWSSMLALGAMLGGLVAAVFGAETAFVADALTFLLSAWFISRIAPSVGRRQIDVAGRGGWLDFVDGFRYLRSEIFILAIGLVKGAGSLIWGAVNVLEITFAERIFPISSPVLQEVFRIEDAGTATLGIIYAVSGIGTGLGPLLVRHWLGDSLPRLLAGISLGFILMSGGIWGLGVAPTFPLFLLMTLLRTIGTGTVWVFSAAMLQIIVPDRFRGRVFAFEFAVLTLTQSLSTFWAGTAQDTLGLDVRQVAMTTGVAGFGVALIWFLFHIRNRSRLGTMNVSVVEP
jgi:predicted MFS family arabinose efflux permease